MVKNGSLFFLVHPLLSPPPRLPPPPADIFMLKCSETSTEKCLSERILHGGFWQKKKKKNVQARTITVSQLEEQQTSSLAVFFFLWLWLSWEEDEGCG